MTAVVAVEVAPAPPADDRKFLVLLGACSRALPAGTCEAASNQHESAAVARVSWEASGGALVTVRLRGSEQDLARELTFSAADPERERWRSVGLTIATMVDELQVQNDAEPPTASDGEGSSASADLPPPATAPQATPSVANAPRTPRAPEPARPTSFELGAIAGSGVGGGLRGGVYARGARDLATLPAFASVRVAHLVSSLGLPSVGWTELAVGAGLQLTPPYVRIESGLDAQLVRVRASARSPMTPRVDTAASWLLGAAVHLSASWPAQGPLLLRVGVRGAWLAREIVVTNAGRELGRIPPYNLSAEVGARLAF